MQLWSARCTACRSDVVIKMPASHLKLQRKCCVCFPLNAGPLRFSFSAKPFWSCCWLQSRQHNLPVEGICSWGGGGGEEEISHPSANARNGVENYWCCSAILCTQWPILPLRCPFLKVSVWLLQLLRQSEKEWLEGGFSCANWLLVWKVTSVV